MTSGNKCVRCSQMKATKNNPAIATSICGTCENSYCYECFAAHARGKCYICSAEGACYGRGRTRGLLSLSIMF